MAIRVKMASVDEKKIAAKVKDRVALQTRRQAEFLGTAMADNAKELMNQKFRMRREPNRRRYPNTVHADEAIWYEVVGNRNFPFNVRYKVYGGKQVELRILGMNYGTRPHYISPSKAIDRNGYAFLAFPDNEDNPSRWGIYYYPVWHPGTKPTNLLETARDQAVRQIFGTPLRTRRTPL